MGQGVGSGTGEVRRVREVTSVSTPGKSAESMGAPGWLTCRVYDS